MRRLGRVWRLGLLRFFEGGEWKGGWLRKDSGFGDGEERWFMMEGVLIVLTRGMVACLLEELARVWCSAVSGI